MLVWNVLLQVCMRGDAAIQTNISLTYAIFFGAHSFSAYYTLAIKTFNPQQKLVPISRPQRDNRLCEPQACRAKSESVVRNNENKH